MFALLGEAISLLLRLIGIAQAIQFVTNILTLPGSQQPPDSALAVIDARVATIETEVESPIYGLAHIEATIVLDTTSILNAIANLTNGTTPVVPVTPPPTGYGGGATAAEVWAYPVTDTGFPASTALGKAGGFAHNYAGQSMLPSFWAPLFWLQGSIEEWDDSELWTQSPNPDVANILSTDTVVSWLTRELGAGWSVFGSWGASGHASVQYVADSGWQWICQLDDAQFAALQALLFPPVSSLELAPVWPGVARVTLGTTLALVNGLFIPGPLDGVIVVITAVPNPIGFYPFGPVKSYVHVGGIAFVDDNGDVETVQPIGLDSNVVCPKSMAQADHAYIRLQSGVVGTVTPWTRT